MDDSGLDIAIVGMACRFPGAPNVDAYWANLCAGHDGITRSTRDSLIGRGHGSALVEDVRFVPASGILDGDDTFDADLFDISPREALVMNPQHRKFLECVVDAFDSAAIDPNRFEGRIAVFAGVGRNRHEAEIREALADTIGIDEVALELGNEKDYFATRVAYKLGLTGPAVTVQSACSTGLVAAHQAILSLLAQDSDLAVVGASAVRSPRELGYLARPGSIASTDGYCRPFDMNAAGSVPGDGVASVILRRLSDAVAGGDDIRAVIRGSAINNDGAKAGFANVSRHAQTSVIRAALASAGAKPADLGFVEAHGSGTRVGDAIEWAALRDTFQGVDPRTCVVGAVKGNVGHLREASGLAGLIKAALTVRNGFVPPSAHLTHPSPELDMDASPVWLSHDGHSWPEGSPRVAGVSSFGLGGTNAHIVLSEAPPPTVSAGHSDASLIVFSAKSPDALDALTSTSRDFLQGAQESLADIAYTSQVGRRQFMFRRCVVGTDTAATLRALDGEARGCWTGSVKGSPGSASFLLPGLGDQYQGMGAGLYREIPEFREAFDRCAQIVVAETGDDLARLLFAANTSGRGDTDLRTLFGRGAACGDPDQKPLTDTSIAHPALVAVEYALATTLMSWGVVPSTMLGHSLGEYVAATLAGVMAIEDTVRLVCRRAQLISQLPAGGMLAASLSEDAAAQRSGRGVSLAAINSPQNVVFAGDADGIDRLASELGEASIPARRLPVQHAFHSRHLEPIANDFQNIVATVRLKPPRIPYLSNVTGRWITTAQATDPQYWRAHLVAPVQFERGARELSCDGPLIEIGPGSLASWVRQSIELHHGAEPTVLSTVRRRFEGGPDLAPLLETVGRLWLGGLEVDWRQANAAGRRRVGMPGYPFNRQHFEVPTSNEPSGVDGPARPQRVSRAGPRRTLPVQRRPSATSIELELADFWCRLLGIEAIERHISFFEIGGDSLLGTHILAYFSDAYGVTLPSSLLFEVPTVAGMAATVERWLATPVMGGRR